MDSPFLIFLALTTVILGLVFIYLRRALRVIADQAGAHAKAYPRAYVKCSALIALSVIGNFKETFHALTGEMATRLAWWDWVILFSGPIAAGLAVLVAFLDRSFSEPPLIVPPRPDNPPQQTIP